ncbi:MAG: gliding motility-associated C-terminal domain-containing protein, partial [Janthinobacterium lividum]
LVATTPTFTSTTLADGDQVQVEVSPTTGFCATGPATAVVTVHLIPVPLPTVTMSSKTVMPVCEGTPLVFSLDNTTNPGATPAYQWQVDGKDVAGATSPVFSTTTLHEGQVVTLNLIASTICGPKTVASAGVVAHVDPTVDVDAGPDQEVMEGDAITLQGTANGTYPVSWTPALGLSSVTVLQPRALPPVGTTVYTLAATRGQCSDTSQVKVLVHPHLRIPNVFSPNGDGDDDTWQIEHIEEYTNNHVTIFNRWGSKLFETTNYGPGNEWAGTMAGQPAPVGTYYYIVQVKGHAYTGPLTIIY